MTASTGTLDKARADLQKDGNFARLFNQWFDRNVSKLPTAN